VTKRRAEGDTVRTSLILPRALWRELKVKALDEGRDLRDLIIEAIRAYLGKK